MYLPLVNTDLEEHQRSRRYGAGGSCSLPFGKVAKATVCLPLFAFVSCVSLSVVKDFASTVITHCGVATPNLLPSVSAAIGALEPQKSIWQASVAVHAPFRLLISALYFDHYRRVIREGFRPLVAFVCALNVLEVLSLIGLSFWSSTENYPVHKTCFMIFVAVSELYMALSCVLLQCYRRLSPSEIERLSLQVKWRMFGVNVSSFLAAGYFYMRHNSYCEAYVYTLFAIAEYVVILTNMGFHMTAVYDFFGRRIVVEKFRIGVS